MKDFKEFKEIRLVFDHYMSVSLMSGSRKSKKKTNEHLDTKLLYGNWWNLTNYSKQILWCKGITYANTYDVIPVTNSIKDFNLESENHHHEEVGMLGSLHSIEAAKRNIFTECCIFMLWTSPPTLLKEGDRPSKVWHNWERWKKFVWNWW